MKKFDRENLETGGSIYDSPEYFREMLVAFTALRFPWLMAELSTYLKAEHFKYSFVGEVYKASVSVVARDGSATPFTLFEALPQHIKLNNLESPQRVAQIVNDLRRDDEYFLVTDQSLRSHAEKIIDDNKKFRLEQIAGKFIESLKSEEKDSKEIFEEINQALIEFINDQPQENSAVFLGYLLKEVLLDADKAHKGEEVGISTGFASLDKNLNGLQPGQLYMLAARPSMGKSALATNIAFNVASRNLTNPQDKKNALFFSLEMPAKKLATRILSEQSKIAFGKIEKGDFTSGEFAELDGVSRKLNEVGLLVDDKGGLDFSAIASRARRYHLKHKIALIVVDYLQLVETEKNNKNGNRVYEVEKVSRGLKSLSKELNVPVIALSQLNRGVENRDDKRPQLSDLRDSGAIEQDADVVMFIYRDAYYEARKQPADKNSAEYKIWEEGMNKLNSKAEIIIAKNRYKEINIIDLQFDGKFTKFSDVEEQKQ